MEATRVHDGILLRVKLVVDRNVIADRIASTLAEVRVPPEDVERSEDEVMEDTIAEISASRRERCDHDA